MLFFIGCLSFFAGIASGAFSGEWTPTTMIWAIFPLILVLLTEQRIWMTLLIAVIAFVGGNTLSVSSYQDRIEHIHTLRDITHQFSGKYSITARVAGSLYQSDLRESHLIEIDTLSTKNGEVVDLGEQSIRLLLDIPKNLKIQTGDRLDFDTKIQPIYSGTLDGFERYTFFHDIAGKTSPATFRVMERSPYDPLVRLANWTEHQLFRGFPREVASILLGITVGNTELMSKNLQTNFRNAGITHILVVSGSNITFLLIFLASILRYIPMRREVHIILLITGVLLYSTLVGWSPPVIRATIMGSIAYLALLSGQKVSTLSLLLIVSVLFLGFSPLSLIYDPSFGLSFGATLSIILFSKPLQSFLKKWNTPQMISEVISVTIAASLGTLPVTLYHFGQISAGFFLANIAIGLIMGGLLFFTTWYLLLGLLGEVFLYWFGWVIYFPTLWIILIAEYIGKWGMITVSPPWDTISIASGVLLWIIGIFMTLPSLKQTQTRNAHRS